MEGRWTSRLALITFFSMTLDDWKLLGAVLGGITGPVGAVTGILGLWRQHRRDLPRLRVSPYVCQRWVTIEADGPKLTHECELTTQAVIEQPDEGRVLHCEIVNLSTFPVTIRDVGLLLKEGRSRKGAFSYDCTFEPKRIESGGMLRIQFADYLQRLSDWSRVREVRVAIATGQVFSGSNKALRTFGGLRRPHLPTKL